LTPGRQLGAFVLLRLVRHHDDLHDALGIQALGDLQRRMAFGPLAHGLAAGHGTASL
jgi:hypothetical protein